MVVFTVLVYSLFDFYFDKGVLVTVAITSFPWFGYLNGYVAARFYTFFNGSSWFYLALYSSIFLPGFCSICFAAIDACEWIETGRADTIPIREAAVLCYYHFFVHTPSCFAGCYMSFSRPPIEPPVKKSRIRREERPCEMPYWCEIPGIALLTGFIPTLVVMMQIW